METFDQLKGGVQMKDGQISYQCHKCDRIFPSRPSLVMHTIRTHGKGWSTTSNFKHFGRKKPLTAKQRREHKRAMARRHNAAMRARYIARGLTSSGRERKRPLVAAPTKNARKRIQFVYPVPKKEPVSIDEAIRNTWPEEPTRPMVAEMNFCPHCGEKLASWKKDV